MYPHDPNQPPPPQGHWQQPQQGWPQGGQQGYQAPHPGYAPQPGYHAGPAPGYPPQPGPGYVPYHGGPQQPGWPQPAYVQPTKSGGAGRVLLIIFGAIGLFISFLVWLGGSYEGFHVSFLAGLFAALGAFMIAWGSMGSAAGKKKLLVGGIVGGLLMLVFGATGPTVGAKVQRDNEETKWEELQAGTTDPLFDPYAWRDEYETTPEQFKREGWQGKWMLARVSYEKSNNNVAGVRLILGEIANDGNVDYSEARDAASVYITAVYDTAIARLKAPAKTDQGAALVDENLRSGFVQVLHAFSASPEANLYLAFGQNVDMNPADGDADALASIRNSPTMKQVFPAGAPIIDQGEAFKRKYDVRRRNMFMHSMSDAFHDVFDDELLHIVALEEGESRDGKHVLEVNSHIRRIPFYGSYYNHDELGQKVYKGLTMEFVVVWSFRLVDPDGETIYQAEELVSEAAPEVGLGDGGPSPVWAIYCALMDSAYYNYSREVVTRFGLNPPPERSIFPFQAVSAS